MINQLNQFNLDDSGNFELDSLDSLDLDAYVRDLDKTDGSTLVDLEPPAFSNSDRQFFNEFKKLCPRKREKRNKP
jgi:hypothetical protein